MPAAQLFYDECHPCYGQTAFVWPAAGVASTGHKLLFTTIGCRTCTAWGGCRQGDASYVSTLFTTLHVALECEAVPRLLLRSK
jgi:hypothetical protein